MALSRSEICKRYRAKKKATDANYMKKEREWKLKAYVPVDLLFPTDLNKRRKSVNQRVKKHYVKNRRVKESPVIPAMHDIPNTRSKGRKLCVALAFKGMKKNDALRKRHSMALKNAYREIENLRQKNQILKREKKTIQRKILRCEVPSSTSVQTSTSDAGTPNSKTNKEMKALGLCAKKNGAVKKRLLFSNVVRHYRGQLSTTIIRKYRCKAAAKRMFGPKWKKYLSITEREKAERKRKSKQQLLKEKVVSFMEREDNSTVMPGKKDCSAGKIKIQKRVLNDYLHNLHSNFCLENPEIKISRALFCRFRPKHILLANFCSRKTCLCSRHQNIALKLRSLHNQGAQLSKNPDVMIKNMSDEEIRLSLENDVKKEMVKYIEWKRVLENGKNKWRQVEQIARKNDFIVTFMKEVEEFRAHVSRVKVQYCEMKQLRENLPAGHVLIWMDFAENFTCTALEEVQSAYWTANMVTLHTSVVYFPSSNSKSHMSIVGISETLSHNANTVYSMIKKLIPIVKNEYPGLEMVHYLTDSPTSQYRNKTIFNLACEHETVVGAKATWDYLEAGHGKGPCDGLGASVKRTADSAIKQGKASIQCAADFYKWATQTGTSSVVTYYYVSQEEYNVSETFLNEKSKGLKAIPGTMQIHSVVPVSDSQIAVRKVSCYCMQCLECVRETTCEGWSFHAIKGTSMGNNNEDSRDDDIQCIVGDNFVDHEEIKPSVGQYVVAMYEGAKYVGLIIEVDEAEGDAKINFMTESMKRKNAYVWPSSKDEIWVKFPGIISIINEPIATGKSKRVFTISDKDAQNLN